ncbi:hypothetical protein PSAB6_110105 [Paraburkholderia sabiae]|jgi:hypothetical protein|nr:hypothetical protein PSAB6_110105 [Paraburkholderia sabiae]
MRDAGLMQLAVAVSRLTVQAIPGTGRWRRTPRPVNEGSEECTPSIKRLHETDPLYQC